MEFIAGILFIAFIGFLVYVFRDQIKNTLKAKDPYTTSWRPSRKTILERRIEDANAEMEWLKDRGDKKTENTN